MLTDAQIHAMLDARAARAEGLAPERILQSALSTGPTTRLTSWRPALSALGGLAVAAAIIGIVVLGGNLGSGPPSSSGVGAIGSGSPSPSPVATRIATPVPTPVATPTGSPVPARACAAAQLAAGILVWQGAAGSRIADVRLDNVSAATCTVPAGPGLQLLDAKGAVLIASAASGPKQAGITLNAGANLTTSVEVTNYCGPDPTLPLTVAFLLADGNGRVVAAPLKNDPEASFAVPPCMGVTPAQISMNGWR